MSCPRMTGCPIFPEFRMVSTLKTMQALYCEGDYQRCERSKSMAKGIIPPRDLLPDGSRLAPKKQDAKK